MHGQRGFTYVMMVVAIAIAGVLLAATGQAYSEQQRRAREQELLRIGAALVRAIESYYESSPGTEKMFPPRLEDLLQDNRFAGTKRHLRRLYSDPMTGKAEWGLVKSASGGIAGVHSFSERQPLKTQIVRVAGQDVRFGSQYRDVKFVFSPPPKSR